MELKPARVRFAPSPTGHLHLGGARTALYDYLLARRTGGKFILRIEDTDQRRYVPEAEQDIMEGLRWLGIPYDEGPDIGGSYGPYRQTERMDIYKQHADILVQNGHAYPCFCSPERLEQMRQEQQKRKENPRYDGTCRRLSPAEAARRVAFGEKHVIRFRMPESGSTIAHDLLRGDITVENTNIGDYVIMTSNGGPTYHLTAMVDDHLMEISHVIRGSEWLSTFPLHVNIVRAFGWQEHEWVHLSVFLKPSGKGKMSKRETAEAQKDGYSIFLKDMQGLGYTPEGVLNWGAFLKPGKYFTATTDSGPKHKRGRYGEVLSKHANRVMKDSMDYFETFRSKFASAVLHGIGPAVWDGRDRWCPDPVGIEDVLVPNKTLLTCRNLPYFAIYRSYTANELILMTRGPNV